MGAVFLAGFVVLFLIAATLGYAIGRATAHGIEPTVPRLETPSAVRILERAPVFDFEQEVDA